MSLFFEEGTHADVKAFSTQTRLFRKVHFDHDILYLMKRAEVHMVLLFAVNRDGEYLQIGEVELQLATNFKANHLESLSRIYELLIIFQNIRKGDAMVGLRLLDFLMPKHITDYRMMDFQR